MPPTLLTSASARDRQDAVSRWLTARRDGEPIRLIGPSFDALTQLIGRTVTEGAVLGWRRHTLGTLATELAQPELAERNWVVAEPLALTGVVLDALAMHAGDLEQLDAVFDMPGLPRAVQATLTELRLARIPQRHIPQPLQRLARTYDRLLTERALADRAMVLNLAAQRAVRQRTVLVDVLPRWPAERELVRALVGDDTLATAPVGAATGIRHLADALGVIPRRFPVQTPGALGAVQTRLFTDASSDPTPLDDTVRILSAPGAQREAIELARCIQDAVDSGVSYDQVGIVLHRPDGYLGPVLEALDRAGIPAFTPQAVPVPYPSGRAFLTLLNCVGHDVDAGGLCDFLSMSTLPSNSVSRRWEHWLARAHASGPSERYRQRLTALQHSLSDRPRQADEVRALTAQVLPLVDTLEALPTQASWTEWADHLIPLAQASLHDADEVLNTLRSLRALGDRTRASLRDVTRLLTPQLVHRPARESTQRAGKVWVGRTQDVLGLHFRWVMIPGLAEREFPIRIREDPLLLDTARRALPELVTNAERADSERSALQTAVGAATERVVLSWPRVDGATGRPFVPSFYTLEVLRAATGELPGFDTLQRIALRTSDAASSWPAPTDPTRAVDEAEHDLSLLADVVRRKAAPIPGLAHYLLDTNPHLARALRARARRWTVSAWTQADGLVRPRPSAHGPLQEHRLAERSVSVTALERFAACPYQYFLATLMHLRPRPDLGPVERLEPETRGELFHAVIADLVHAAAELPQAERLEAASNSVSTVLSVHADALRAQLAPSVPRIWDDAIDALRVDLHAAVHHLFGDSIWAPVHAEHAVRTAEGTQVFGAKLHGVADLVERTAHGQLRVTDLKTGALRYADPARVAGGTMLQPALYARLLQDSQPDAPVVGGRLLAATRKHAFRTVEVPLDAQTDGLAQTVVHAVDKHIEQGCLPASPAPGACTDCDFTTICGTSEEQRIRHKRPLADLAAIRRLP